MSMLERQSGRLLMKLFHYWETGLVIDLNSTWIVRISVENVELNLVEIFTHILNQILLLNRSRGGLMYIHNHPVRGATI
jgi:hypothetical protein